MLNGTTSTNGQRAAMPHLSNCDREPIHIPGSIQPHGVLLVLAPPDFRVLQASENCEEMLAIPSAAAIGGSLANVFGAELAEKLEADLAQRLLDVGAGARALTRPVFLRTVTIDGPGGEARFHAIAHRAEGNFVLELERVTDGMLSKAFPDVHPLVDAFTLQVEAAESVSEMSRIVCDEVRRLTGFDRVLIYRFDDDWNGTVIGESGSGRLPAYLHHRFPASDIPEQARELYRVNRLRMIPDAEYEPVAITPAVHPNTGRPLNLTFSTLRSVSPIHVQYMRNMQTAASMSVSILRRGRLWGLISCHHREPRRIAFTLRGACDLFARAFSLRLSALEHAEEYEQRIVLRSAYSKLVSVLADGGDFSAALMEHPQDLLAVARAQGAALAMEDGCRLTGTTPSEKQVRELAQWLFQKVSQEVYETDRLPSVIAEGHDYKDTACGLLAVAISKLHPSYLFWFRPEVVQTIQWGGDPNKPLETSGDDLALHPRRSFETWRETVRDRSLPWSTGEVEAATELRHAIVGTVLRRAEELAALNAELTHSNKELEAFSYSVSHDLRAPLRHIVGYAEILRDEVSENLSSRGQRCIATIIESSEYAGRLVDKLLGYSRLGRSELQRSQVDLKVLFDEVKKDVMQDAEGRTIVWHFEELPSVSADLMMLRMAVRDLLSNAVKYTRERDEAVIEVRCHEDGDEHTVSVTDNGVGFNMEYADKLFGVFQRLHRWEEYEGTGIGLANVRRVMERHGGRTWALGEEGKGATFFFTLPKSSSSTL